VKGNAASTDESPRGVVIPIEKTLALLVPLLPAIGVAARLVALSAGSRFGLLDVVVAEPLPVLAAIGVIAISPAVFIFVLSSLDRPPRKHLVALMRRKSFRRRTIAALLAITAAFAVLVPGGIIIALTSVPSSGYAGWRVGRLGRSASWTKLFPSVAIMALSGVLFLGLSGEMRFTIADVRFVNTSPARRGSYIDLGRTSQSLFLLPCATSDSLLVVPLTDVSLETVRRVTSPPPSLLEAVQGERSLHLGANLDCSTEG
jgi:hypothetical protein